MQNTFFQLNQKLVIPDLADKLSIKTPEFIIKDIFQGGMGTCAKIETQDNQIFALKIIHSSLLENEVAMQRYVEEMKTWLTLSACNGVVEAISLTKINEIPCIAARWMNYGSLRPFLKNVNPDFFYRNMDRIISTLNWTYSKYKIIHRDLKPENILLDKDGNAFLADWGLSRPISKPNNDSNLVSDLNKLSNRIDLTDAGCFMGTIVYASPEQILGNKNIDHRSDIYSLGCMMYEWETGIPPFIAPTAQNIAMLHLNSKPKKISGVFKSTNYKVEYIIEKCLEKYPENRYQTYDELIADLQKVAIKSVNYKKFTVTERDYVPFIGENEFVDKLKNKDIKGTFSKDGKHALLEESKIMPYFKEAINLMSIGEYEKAKNIFKGFFKYEMFTEIPDVPFIQNIAINYSLSLKYLNDIDNAIIVLNTIENAENKPAEYYVNLSQYYLLKNEYELTETICKEGLLLFPKDIDIIGNLTISLSNQNKMNEAVDTAINRLSISRDVHSLEEAALVICSLAENQKNTDFPNAIKNYQTALSLLQEAKQLNPMFITARLSIANILFKLKKYSESSNEIAEINQIQKGTPEIGAFYLARNLLWTSTFESGKEFCERMLKYFPSSLFIKRVYVEIMIDGYLLNGKSSEVENFIIDPVDFLNDCLKDKINVSPKDYKFLAKIYMWMGKAENANYASALLESGKQHYPNYWQYDFYLAALLNQYNQPQNALLVAFEAKRKAPWRETILNLISSIYRSLGDIENEKKYLFEYESLKRKKQEFYNNTNI